MCTTTAPLGLTCMPIVAVVHRRHDRVELLGASLPVSFSLHLYYYFPTSIFRLDLALFLILQELPFLFLLPELL